MLHSKESYLKCLSFFNPSPKLINSPIEGLFIKVFFLVSYCSTTIPSGSRRELCRGRTLTQFRHNSLGPCIDFIL